MNLVVVLLVSIVTGICILCVYIAKTQIISKLSYIKQYEKWVKMNVLIERQLEMAMRYNDLTNIHKLLEMLHQHNKEFPRI